MTIDRNNLNFSPKLIVWSFHNLSILTNDDAQNQKQAENGLFLQIKSERILVVGVFDKTIISVALVGCEMIVANSALRVLLAITISYAPSWNNC